MHHRKSFPQVALIRMFTLDNFIHRFTHNFYIIGANVTDSSAQLAFIQIITSWVLAISRRKKKNVQNFIIRFYTEAKKNKTKPVIWPVLKTYIWKLVLTEVIRLLDLL